MGTQPFGGILELGEGGDGGEPFPAETTETAVRSANSGFFLRGDGGFLGGVPLVDQGLDGPRKFFSVKVADNFF
jgi:hypothetical protein